MCLVKRKTVEILVVQFSLTFCYFFPRGSKYSNQQSVLKYSQSLFFHRERANHMDLKEKSNLYYMTYFFTFRLL